jgi:hypothetical protein
MFCFVKHQTMEKVQKPSNPKTKSYFNTDMNKSNKFRFQIPVIYKVLFTALETQFTLRYVV